MLVFLVNQMCGKSSLLNYLSKKDKAIVTDIEGTTRDVVEETINIGDLILNISDTAGIRETDDKIEKIGVEKSIKKIDEIDLAIYMFDNEKQIGKEDLEILLKIQNKGIKILLVINKVDELQKSKINTFMNELNDIKYEGVFEISISNKFGIEKVINKIKELFLKDNINSYNENIIISERQIYLLKESKNILKKVNEDIDKDIPIDIIQINLKQSADKLGEIIGYNISEDIVNKIFSKFCLGK